MGLLALALLLLGAAAMILASDGGRFRGWVEAAATDALGVPVRIHGTITPALGMTPALELGDVELRADDPAELPLELRFGEVAVRIDLRTLLRERELRVIDLWAKRGTILYLADVVDDDEGEGVALGEILGELTTEIQLEDVALEEREGGTTTALLHLAEATLAGCDAPARLHGNLGGEAFELRAFLRCPSPETLTLEELRGELGASDAAGTLTIDASGERLRIEGQVHSNRIEVGEADPDPSPADPDAVLDEALPFPLLDLLDARLALRAEELALGPETVAPFEGQITLEAGAAALEIEEAGLWGGMLRGRVAARSRAKPPELAVDLTLQDALLSAILLDPEADGRVELEADAKGTGATLAALLADASGVFSLVQGETTGTGSPLGPLGRNVLEILFAGIAPKDRGRLHCAVIRAEVEHGLGRTGIVVDSPKTTLAGGGKLNLREGTVDVVLRPKPKRANVGAVTTPIRISGPILEPDTTLETRGMAVEVGTLWAFYLVNPYLLVVPLIDLGTGEENACEAALDDLIAASEHHTPVQRTIDNVMRFINELFSP